MSIFIVCRWTIFPHQKSLRDLAASLELVGYVDERLGMQGMPSVLVSGNAMSTALPIIVYEYPNLGGRVRYQF